MRVAADAADLVTTDAQRLAGAAVTGSEALAASAKRFMSDGLDETTEAILQRTDAVPRLGNLTLVHYGVNRSLQNKAFDVKRKALFDHSNLHLNRQLMQLERWDEASITSRGEALADVALKIWPGPGSIDRAIGRPPFLSDS